MSHSSERILHFSLYQKPIPKSNSRTLRSPQRVPTCINISTRTTPLQRKKDQEEEEEER